MTPPPRHSTTPSPHHSIISSLGAVLLALTLAGCGPQSDKAGKQTGTNTMGRQLLKTNQPALARSSAKTNPPPAAAPAAPKAKGPPVFTRPGVRTNAVPAVARPGSGTNVATALAKKGTGTNAAPVVSTKGGLAEALRNLQANRAFYPVLGVVFLCLCLAGVLVARLLKAKARKGAIAEVAPKAVARPAKRKPSKVSIHSCNVLQVGPQSRQIWQFDARGRGFALNREQTTFAGEALPAKLVAKGVSSLWQRKLNIAWLPLERVFLRVAQFPASDFDETLAMVELQLEKLSPIPVTQIVWSIQVLPHAEGTLQTVIVMIAARNDVEEFLGQLEGQGYLADRLDLPQLDQLQATTVTQNGAWIYPEAPGGRNAALVAWWYGGVLHNLDLITLPATKRPEALKEQLLPFLNAVRSAVDLAEIAADLEFARVGLADFQIAAAGLDVLGQHLHAFLRRHPAQHVAIAAYGDETHVDENRRLYRQKFDLADQIVGARYSYARPPGGFFLWLDVPRFGREGGLTERFAQDGQAFGDGGFVVLVAFEFEGDVAAEVVLSHNPGDAVVVFHIFLPASSFSGAGPLLHG